MRIILFKEPAMWNLRNRLLIPILGVAVFGLVLASFASYFIAEKALEKSVMNDATGSATDLADLISVVIGGAYSDGQLLAGTFLVMDAVNPATDTSANLPSLRATLKNLVKKKPYYQLVHVMDARGMVVVSSVDSPPKDSLAERAYFKAAMRGDENYISEPIKSATTGKSVMPLATPIMLNGKAAGVLLITLDLAAFSKAYVESIELGERGYALIVTPAGNVLAHRDSSQIMSAELGNSPGVQRFKTISRGEGDFIAAFQGSDTLYVFRQEPITKWFCVVRSEVEDIFSSVRMLGRVSTAISAGVAVVIALVVFLVVRSIVGALNQGVEFAAAVAGGNLDKSLNVRRGDEIGTLADALRAMVSRLKEMISTAEQKNAEAAHQTEKANAAVAEAEEARKEAEKARSEGMRQAGRELAAIAGKIEDTTRDLVAQVRQAAGGADTQRRRTTEAATAMEEMNATVLEVARNAGAASSTAEQAKKNAEEGARIVSGVISSITEVDGKTGELKVSLHDLGEKAQGIGRIMSVITDIADQTNLLALNAAIEAARAGEAGRGFAVVADEVRKLAEKTMTATKEVGDAVKAIQSGTAENIKGMNDASQSVVKSTEMVREAGNSLKAIVDMADNTADKVRSIAAASEEQSAASEEITQGTEEITRIADETAVQMERAQTAVDHLSRMVADIQELVGRLQKA